MYKLILVVVLVVLFCCNAVYSAGAPPKKIYGHFMGCFSAGTGAIQYHARSGLSVMDAPSKVLATNPLKRDIAAFAGKSFGGTYRNFGLAPYEKTMTLEESADLEIQRAMRIGLDGFTFDAWAGGSNAIKLFDAMFGVCEVKKYPFELTISLDSSCISDDMPELKDYTGNKWVKCVKWLLDKHGKSPNLARRDGKPLIMGYQSLWPAWETFQARAKKNVGVDAEQKDIDQEVCRLVLCEEGWKLYGDAYRQMAQDIGTPIYWEFCMSAFFYTVNIKGVHPKPDVWVAAARTLAKDFPAVGMFMWEGPVPEISKAVIAEGAEWCHPMKIQYENYGWMQIASPGTDWVRGDWKAARETPSTLIQFITWNDYHETTNLSPGWNTRYSYYDLTGWNIKWWKTGTPPEPDHDQIYIFSHKYAHNTKMYPFKAKNRADNLIEIITILPKSAQLRVLDREFVDGGKAEWTAPVGYSYKQLKLTPGTIVVELLRDDKVIQKLEHPEPVSDRPYRQDTGKTCWSTEEERYWKLDFGEKIPMFVYSEYGDTDGDGLPNWFEMLWFGKFGDMSTATVAKPDDDPDEDGKTNLQEYLAQTDPTKEDVEKPLTTDEPN
ncbi:MAG: hypothetical protein WCO98_03080 [bacterium]